MCASTRKTSDAGIRKGRGFGATAKEAARVVKCGANCGHLSRTTVVHGLDRHVWMSPALRREQFVDRVFWIRLVVALQELLLEFMLDKSDRTVIYCARLS